MNKTEEFNNLIHQAYGKSDLLDEVKNQINNARETMSKYDEFKKLSVESQFNFCCTICIIATQTARQDLHKLNNLKKQHPEEEFEYSINRGIR